MNLRKPSFYTPGMISLVLLPLLVILFLSQRKAFVSYNAIDLSLMRKDGDEEFRKIWEVRSAKTTFTPIYLTGNDALDSVTCRKAQIILRDFKASKDTLTGIKFHLSEKTKYWAFVRILDIFAIEDIAYYWVDEREITVLNPILRPSKYKPIPNGFLGNCVVDIVEKEAPDTAWMTWPEVKNLLGVYCLPILAYLLMLLFTIRKILAKSRLKIHRK